MLEQDGRQRLRGLRRTAERRVRIEVVRRYLPEPRVLLQDRGGTAALAHAEIPERLGSGLRLGDRLPGLFLRVTRASPWHEHMFARTSDGNGSNLKLGSQDSNPVLVGQGHP